MWVHQQPCVLSELLHPKYRPEASMHLKALAAFPLLLLWRPKYWPTGHCASIKPSLPQCNTGTYTAETCCMHLLHGTCLLECQSPDPTVVCHHSGCLLGLLHYHLVVSAAPCCLLINPEPCNQARLLRRSVCLVWVQTPVWYRDSMLLADHQVQMMAACCPTAELGQYRGVLSAPRVHGCVVQSWLASNLQESVSY
jgi:hypothetical protein